jgi:thiol-disulfide isomerase/thioredoxin
MLITGSYRPKHNEYDLTILDGRNINGTWILEVMDIIFNLLAAVLFIFVLLTTRYFFSSSEKRTKEVTKMATYRNSDICKIPLIVTICLFTSLVQAQYSGGTGEPNDPYRIASTVDLIRLSIEINDWDKHFVLMNDISLEGNIFTDALIGTSKIMDEGWYEGTPFTGTFDGNSFTIRNLLIDTNGRRRDCVGLFGIIGLEGAVKNLNLEDTYIIASNYVGALTGINEGKIRNCINDGIICGDKKIGGLVGGNRGNIINSYTGGEVCVGSNDIDSNDVGGLAGVNSFEGIINHCQSTCEINGLQRKCENFGGLVGCNRGIVLNCRSAGSIQGENNENINFGGFIGKNVESVINCYSEGSVRGNSQNAGGLIGYNDGRVSNSYSSGGLSVEVEVEGSKYVGGLIGYNGSKYVSRLSNSIQGHVINCYSTGKIVRGSYRGGLIGYNTSNTKDNVASSVWDVDKSGLDISAGGIGFTTQQMGEIGNYYAMGWDLAGNKEDGLHEIWQIPRGGRYPILSIFNGYEPAHLVGQGTVEDPYLISDANELASVLYSDPKANYLSTGNIDLSGINWSDSIIPVFKGVFDGNKYTISNIKIIPLNSENKLECLGLFGAIHPQSELKNLNVNDVAVLGSNYIGGLTGVNEGLITNCSSTGRVGGDSYVGGLTGNNIGRIRDCNSTTIASGKQYNVGGLVGKNAGSITQCCSNCDNVIGMYYVGGLVGDNYDGNISQCYSNCNEVVGESFVGGLVGDNDDGTITDCYHIGFVSGDRKVGGLVGNNVGYNSKGCLENSYNVGQVEGNEDVGEIAGDNRYVDDDWIPAKVYYGTIIGCFSNVQVISEYKEAGWDFDHIWMEPRIGERKGYPVLRCQDPPPKYQINDANDLIDLTKSEGLDQYYILTNDIDLSSNPLEKPIGDLDGVFDGNGHVISNLDINLPNSKYVGLFGKLKERGFVKNLVMRDVHVHGEQYVGGIVGKNGGSVENCHVDGEVNGEEHVGGLVGYNHNYIYGCSSVVQVAGTKRIGGLVGDSYGKVIKSMSGCTVNGVEAYVGGLVGFNLDKGEVQNCYSKARVTGDKHVGGLIGRNTYEVKYCYATGKVGGNTNVGGLIGSSPATATTSNSFWNIDTTGQTISEGGTCKTTFEMKMADTFLSTGWNISDDPNNISQKTWWIDVGQDYPHLTWELRFEPLACSVEPNELNEANEPCGLYEPNEVISLTDENFNCVVMNSDLPVLVHFWALFSYDCLRMFPVIEEIAEEWAGKLKVCELVTNDYLSISEKYEIAETPTIILFKDGNIRKKWIGVTDKEDIIHELDFAEP